MRIRAQKSNWSPDIEILIFEGNLKSNSQFRYATKIEFSDVENGVMIDPTAKLEYETAQQLMDDLWICGLRPSEGSGSAGALAATQKHLEDMRQLVFSLLGKVIKE